MDLIFEEPDQQIEIFKVFEKTETHQKYEETDLKFEETNQQTVIFKDVQLYIITICPFLYYYSFKKFCVIALYLLVNCE